jgi:hypothetical protein
MAEESTMEVLYEMGIPFGPCSRMHKKFTKEGLAFSVASRCIEPPSEIWSPTAITATEFAASVFLEGALSDGNVDYAQVDAGSVPQVPQGTTQCHVSPEGAYTICGDERGIVTYQAFDGYKLDPPKQDANRMRILVSFTEE